MKLLFFFLFCIPALELNAQSYPWERPLMIAGSGDGIHFSWPSIFQDSSGVPSMVQWSGDTLVCAFQWFRKPQPSPSWDRVAVKFSYDFGSTWTEPVPIQVSGIPSNYQRPFDPTLTVIDNGQLRVYFSSGDAGPPTIDSLINTYSAVSADGIHYTFDTNARFDYISQHVIDPAVVKFKNMWHYLSPKGAPQDGAFHAISNDGLLFNQVPDIVSDPMHNWTGNYMVNDTGELRFYGCGGPFMWYNSSTNGGAWNGYVNTNLSGGDPTVVRWGGVYLMVYTGPPYASVTNVKSIEHCTVYPNPCTDKLQILLMEAAGKQVKICINTIEGREVLSTENIIPLTGILSLDIAGYKMPPGVYGLKISADNISYTTKVTKR